jgi:hypothetical protein
VEVATAAGEVDLVKAVSDEEGPWVMAFRTSTVQAIAAMAAEQSVVQRWVEAVSAFNGRKYDWESARLTAVVAETLKDLCQVAVERWLGVYCCFYG